MTDVFYYSNRSKPCTLLLQKLEQMPHIRTKFQYVSVDSTTPQHPIRSVPAAIIEGKQYEGKQVFEWLEKETYNNTLPAFETGFGTNNFTSIHDSEAPAESNHNFTYIEEPTTQQQQSQNPQSSTQKGGKPQKIQDNALDDLINQRKQDIPIPRQRA
jgi:hypothetical protein